VSPEDEAFFKEFGKRLAALRRKRGLTQTELADLLGLKQPRILSFEKGRRRMPLSHLKPFAEALGWVRDRRSAGMARSSSTRGSQIRVWPNSS